MTLFNHPALHALGWALFAGALYFLLNPEAFYGW